MIEPVAMSKGWGERTVADLASLVVELGRLYKGLTFYAADHPARRELVDRAFLAWRVNLERAGPLELYLDPAEIRCVGLDESIGSAHQQDLLNALSSRGIRQLRFDPELDRKCFLCFAELLTDEGDAAAAAGFARTLYAAGGAGILVNGETPPSPIPFPSSCRPIPRRSAPRPPRSRRRSRPRPRLRTPGRLPGRLPR